MISDQIKPNLDFLGREFIDEIETYGKLEKLAAGTNLLRPGQYIKVIPLVIEGLLRVYTTREDKELLLYYIKPAESCIMSFSAGIDHSTSQIYADCVEESLILLLPVDKVQEWIYQYPRFSKLMYSQYNVRYLDLLNTVEEVIFDPLDIRLWNHIKHLSSLKQTTTLDIRHHQLANELGTAREVISRIIKRLETQGYLQQTPKGIKILK